MEELKTEFKINEEEAVEEKKPEESSREKIKKAHKSRWQKRKKIPMRVLAKTNYFARNEISYIDYKDIKILQQFINKQGQIIPKKFNLPTKHQRLVAKAIKRARQMALIPYTIVEQSLYKEK